MRFGVKSYMHAEAGNILVPKEVATVLDHRMIKEDGEEGWFFVDDAYVYGMMDLRETLKGKRGEDQIFKIF